MSRWLFDEAGHRLFVGSRSGAISVFDTGTGKELTSLPIGGGVDDMVFDAGSKRLYATCGGDGLIYVYQQRDADNYELAGKVPSGPKGKNGLLSRPRGRFYVIVPPQASTPGAVYVFAVQS
ncbi:MAG TPA: hypothetical protein VH302_04185 [Bryobacteraceae bacterium]|nr:hypothetical protein [Bryobacteraceae bacterium]